jgi:uncharacterized protein (DUF924 family)
MNAPEITGFEAFYLADTSELKLDLPNGEPMLYNGERVVVHLYGPATEQFVAAKDAIDREVAKRGMAAMATAMGNKRKNKEEEDRDADAKFLTAVTDRFDNFPYKGGPAAIYRDLRLKYVADQVRAHLNDLSNFFSSSASA